MLRLIALIAVIVAFLSAGAQAAGTKAFAPDARSRAVAHHIA